LKLVAWFHGARPWPDVGRVVVAVPGRTDHRLKQGIRMGSVIKKRRKRMSKKKHRKLLRKTRVQRRKLKK
jgi:hypothetical protein